MNDLILTKMRECLRSPLRSSKQLDFAFFRKMLEELSLKDM